MVLFQNTKGKSKIFIYHVKYFIYHYIFSYLFFFHKKKYGGLYERQQLSFHGFYWK